MTCGEAATRDRGCSQVLRLAWLYTAAEGLPPNKYARGRKGSKNERVRFLRFEDQIIRVHFLDPSSFPWNPLRKLHTLYAGIDPIRTWRLLASHNEYDGVVAVGESSALLYLWFGAMGGTRKPVALYDPPLEYGWRARRFVLNEVLTRCDGVLVRGSNQRSFLRHRYGPRCRVEVVYHPVDADYWKPREEPTEDYLFTIGNDPGRDFRTLLRAVHGLPVRVIMKTSVKNAAEADKVPNVRVIRERITFDELKDLYAKARMVVIPLKETIHAGGVNSLLEAMSMGKAVIVSRSQGIADYYQHGLTAMEVPVGDWKAMREAIMSLWHDSEKLLWLGRNARQMVLRRFDRPVYNATFSRALFKIFAGHK